MIKLQSVFQYPLAGPTLGKSWANDVIYWFDTGWPGIDQDQSLPCNSLNTTSGKVHIWATDQWVMWPRIGIAFKATTCLTGFCSLSNGAFKVDWLSCLTSSAGKGHLGNRPFVSFENPHWRIGMRFRDKVRNLVPGPLFFPVPYRKRRVKTDTENEAVIAWSSTPTQRWIFT